ncbi:glycerol kinase, partial [Nonomuraea deserti]
MTADPLVLGVDQGTSATKAIVVDASGETVARASAPLAQRHPAPGMVEQDGEELWRSVRDAVSACLAGAPPGRVTAVGLSVQRESLILWDRASGAPLSPLVSWQDRRGTDLCARLAASGAAPMVRRISGLPLDPMFSAAKAAWLLDHHGRDGGRTGDRSGSRDGGRVGGWSGGRVGGRVGGWSGGRVGGR